MLQSKHFVKWHFRFVENYSIWCTSFVKTYIMQDWFNDQYGIAPDSLSYKRWTIIASSLDVNMYQWQELKPKVILHSIKNTLNSFKHFQTQMFMSFSIGSIGFYFHWNCFVHLFKYELRYMYLAFNTWHNTLNVLKLIRKGVCITFHYSKVEIWLL